MIVIGIDDASFVAAAAALDLCAKRYKGLGDQLNAARFATALADLELAHVRSLEQQAGQLPALLRRQI